MVVTLYQNLSDPKRVGKNISAVAQLTNVMWKEDSDILHPVITFHKFKDSNDNQIWKQFNYLSIDNYFLDDPDSVATRYYFVTNLILARGGIIEVHCLIDVRETWKDFILSSRFLVSRQENFYNKMLPDSRVKVPATRQMTAQTVGEVGDGASGSIILTVSG